MVDCPDDLASSSSRCDTTTCHRFSYLHYRGSGIRPHYCRCSERILSGQPGQIELDRGFGSFLAAYTYWQHHWCYTASNSTQLRSGGWENVKKG
jgi:hypothetical protein